jgi:hypothetical protein
MGGPGQLWLRTGLLLGLALGLLAIESVAEGLGSPELALVAIPVFFFARELELADGLWMTVVVAFAADAMSGEPSGIVFGALLYGYVLLRVFAGRRWSPGPARVMLGTGVTVGWMGLLHEAMARAVGAPASSFRDWATQTLLTMAVAWPVFWVFSEVDRQLRRRDELGSR